MQQGPNIPDRADTLTKKLNRVRSNIEPQRNNNTQNNLRRSNSAILLSYGTDTANLKGRLLVNISWAFLI